MTAARKPVDQLVLRCALTRPGQALMKLVPGARPRVRALVIEQRRMTRGEGTWFDSHDHLGDHEVTDRVWARLPGLKQLVVSAGWDIFERIEHHGIEEITIEDGAPFCTVRGHARRWHVPALRSIAWHYQVDCTGTGASATTADFEPIWTARAPALREVDLSRANLFVRPNETPLLEVEGFQRLLPQLATLRLPHQAIGRTPDRLVAAVRKHKKRLAHLGAFTLTKLAGVAEAEVREMVPGFSW